MLTLKVKDNLHIISTEEEVKVISYRTHVATIVDDKICVYGKWSRTTTRQLNELASLTGLPLRPATSSNYSDRYFNKLHYGVQCNLVDSVSTRASSLILKTLKHSRDQVNHFNLIGVALANLADLTKRDRKELKTLANDESLQISVALAKEGFYD